MVWFFQLSLLKTTTNIQYSNWSWMALVITQFQYFFRFSDGLTLAKNSFPNYFPPLPLWLFLALNCVEISTRCAPCYFTQFKVKFDTLIYCWPVYDSLIFSSRLQFECHFDLSVLTSSVHFVRISVYLFNEVVNTLLVNGVERCLLTYLLTYQLLIKIRQSMSYCGRSFRHFLPDCDT